MTFILNNFLGLKILTAETLREARKSQDLKRIDLVKIKKYSKTGFWRPEKISWRIMINSQPIIQQISSQRARKQIKRDNQKIKTKGIEIKNIFPLTEKLFQDWRQLYCRKIKEKRLGRLLIKANWLKERQKLGKKIGAILAIWRGKIIGGNIFFLYSSKLSIGYGVSQKIPHLAGGLGLLIDYYSLNYAQERNYHQVSLGQDTNLYGFHLSTGLLAYKAKLGFKPYPAPKTEWRSLYFLNWDKFNGPVMFFTNNKGAKNKTNLILENLSSSSDKSMVDFSFLNKKMKIQQLPKQTVKLRHRKILMNRLISGDKLIRKIVLKKKK